MGLADRLQHAWNAFVNNDPPRSYRDLGGINTYKPDRVRFSRGNERSIVTAVYNRIAMDACSIKIVHARLDDNNRYIDDITSGLHNCLTLEANVDQTSRAFMQDVVMSLLDEGCIAIVPVDTSVNPHVQGSFDILSMKYSEPVSRYPDYGYSRIG